jgi:hypothetical protein
MTRYRLILGVPEVMQGKYASRGHALNEQGSQPDGFSDLGIAFMHVSHRGDLRGITKKLGRDCWVANRGTTNLIPYL